MADTTPTSNALNLDLANKLNDKPVAGGDNGITAATSGTVFSAEQRNLALAQAYNQLAVRLIGHFGVDGAVQRAEGIIATQSITWSTSGSTINKDFIAPLRVVSSTMPEFLYRPKGTLDTDHDIRIDRAYAIEGGKIYGYIRSAGTLTAQNSGSATFYYVKSDRRDTSTGAAVAVNTSPDTTIDQTWLIWCMEYAALWLAMNKATGRWKEKIAEYMALVEAKLPKV